MKKKTTKKDIGKRIIKWVEEHQNYIVLSLIFLSMVILNCLTPYIFDDNNYSYVWGTSEKVKNLWDIVVSQYKHYFSWGGRSIAHAIAQFFLMYPKMFFNIANSICYVGIISKINSLTTHKKKNAWMILFIHVLLFLIVPYFGEDFLWLIGSCNYAWTTWFILIFLSQFLKEDKKDSVLSLIGMFLLGMIADWSNENTGLALVGMIFLLFINRKFMKKKKINKYQITGWIGSITGYLLLILAPGNYIRSARLEQTGSFMGNVIERSIEITHNALTLLWPLLIGLLVLYTYYIYKKKMPNPMSILYVLGALISAYSMAASPEFPPRAWVGIVIFLGMAMILLLDPIIEKEKIIRFALYDFIIILSVISLKNYYRLAHELRIYNRVIEARKSYIKEHPEEEIYLFEKYVNDDKYSPIHGEDLTEDKENWINQSQARYYKVPYIIGY